MLRLLAQARPLGAVHRGISAGQLAATPLQTAFRRLSSSPTHSPSPHPTHNPSSISAPYTVHDVAQWASQERASSIAVLDVQEVMGGSIGDYLLFATANTSTHMRKIAKALLFELKTRDVVVFGTNPTIEGREAEDWMLIDGGHVVINIFTKSAREHFDLEAHWTALGGSPVPLEIEQEPEQADPAVEAPAAWSSYADLENTSSSDLDPIYAEAGDDVFSESAAKAPVAAMHNTVLRHGREILQAEESEQAAVDLDVDDEDSIHHQRSEDDTSDGHDDHKNKRVTSPNQKNGDE